MYICISNIYLFYTCIYNVQFRPYSTNSKSQMPIRIRSRQPFGVRCCQLTSEQQQASRAEPGSTKCFVCGTTSGTTSERRPDARATLQPCTAPQGLAAKLSSKRHHHLLACGCAGLMLAFIHGKMNFWIWKIIFWNCDGACACDHFQIFGAAHQSAPAPSAREEAAKHAPNYMHVELCLERHQNDVQL